MRITLKKFAGNPRQLIKKAPVIIMINDKPRYAIIPYVVYKTKVADQPSTPIHQNTVTQHMEKDHKKHNFLWNLLFG